MASTMKDGSVMMIEGSPQLESGKKLEELLSNDDNEEVFSGSGSRRKGKGKGWISKVLNLEEAKNQISFSLPIILTTVAYYAMPLVSVMFVGHLGELQLAAATLGQSWATVTGQSLMVGLSGALETLCGQGFGAKQYRMLGIYLQANIIISFFFSILVSILWFFSDTILIALHQDPDVSNEAGLYLKYLIPATFAWSLLHNMLRFVQTQYVIMPLVFFSTIPLILHIGIAYTLVHYTSLGIKGASLATSISMYVSVGMLGVYVMRSERFKLTWDGFSMEAFQYVLPTLKLALPSAGMVCLEYWAFEILVILAGLMPNSKITTSLVAMCVSTEAVAFMVAYGLSAAASVRVSNELGSGNPGEAKRAVAVTLKLTILLALIADLALGFGHSIWAGLFTNSPVIKKKFASMTPLLLISIALDYIQAVLSGVARGCGWQWSVLFINMASYYLVGMLISCVLGFKFKLYAKGLWIGVICGLVFQASGLLYLTLRTKWSRVQLYTQENLETDKGLPQDEELQIPNTSEN